MIEPFVGSVGIGADMGRELFDTGIGVRVLALRCPSLCAASASSRGNVRGGERGGVRTPL